MRNLLAFVAAALLTFAGLGWYLDWYTIQSTPGAGGHREVRIDFNTHKIGADLEKGGRSIRRALEKSGDKDAADPNVSVKKKPPQPQPPKTP